MPHESTLWAWLANFIECQNKIRPDFNSEMDILIAEIDSICSAKARESEFYRILTVPDQILTEIERMLVFLSFFDQSLFLTRNFWGRPEMLAETCALKSPPLPFLDTLWDDLEALYRFIVFLQQLLLILALSLVLLFIHSEFPGGRRYLCTTMPWTIWPALAVLWGVCWMFYPSPTEGQLALENLDLLLDRLDQGK